MSDTAPKDKPRHAGFSSKNNLRDFGMLISLFAIMIFFQVVTDGTLLRPLNLTNLVQQNSYIVIMALGMLLVIVTGHIDLSVGSVAGFIGAVAAVLMVKFGMPSILAVLIALPGARRADRRGPVATASPISRSRPSSSRWRACWCSRAWRSPSSPASRSALFPPAFQKLSSGFIPELVPDAGALYPTSLAIGAVLALVLVWQNFRSRAPAGGASHRDRALWRSSWRRTCCSSRSSSISPI